MRSGFAAGIAAILPLTGMLELARRGERFPVDFPRVLGAGFTKSPERARLLGLPLHLLNAGLFGTGYAVAFRLLGRTPNPRTGALLGLGHGVASSSFLAALPVIHPHPDAAGIPVHARDYAARTWAQMVAGHVGFGMLVGWMLKRAAEDSPRTLR